MTELILTPYLELKEKQYSDEIKIVIEKQNYNGVQFQEGKTAFSIANCDFKKLVIKNDADIDFQDISLGFFGCYIEDIQIQQAVSKNISVFFGSSIVGGKISDSSINSIEFNNCIILSNFFILNQPKLRISYTEENIFARRWESLRQRLSIGSIQELISQKQSYHITNCDQVHIISNFKEDSKGGCYIREHEKNEELKQGYKLTADEKKLLNINISLKYDKEMNYKETKLESLVLNSLSLSGTQGSKIIVENSRITNWYIHDFSPKSEVTFYNISPPDEKTASSKIEFHKSNLDNTSFDNINFEKYELVSFYRTKFSKSIFTSCRFPANAISFEKFKALPNVHYPDVKGDNFYKDQYAVYLQLKTALESTGNFYEAQKLYAISNDALKKIEDVSGHDKFILWVNSISNNHGLSIVRPLVLFLVFTIVLYLLYLWSLDRIFNSNDIDYNLIGYYFSFVDLTHRNDFLVEKSEFNWLMLTIDYITKLLVGFFIYQFVASFRKYGRK